MDHQQGFVVGVSSRGRPVKGSCDHCFVVDHGKFVVEFVATGKPGGADAFEGLIQRLITRFYLAVVIWKADPQQIEHLREGRLANPGSATSRISTSCSIFSRRTLVSCCAENTNRAISRLFFAGFSCSANKLSRDCWPSWDGVKTAHPYGCRPPSRFARSLLPSAGQSDCPACCQGHRPTSG